MLTNIRWKIAATLMERADNLASTGDLRKVNRGLKFAKYAIRVMPPDLEIMAAMLQGLEDFEQTHIEKES